MTQIILKNKNQAQLKKNGKRPVKQNAIKEVAT